MIDWNSSALWGIIGLIGGCLVSLFFFLMGKKRKILTYDIKSTELITKEISAIPNLEILYNKTKISNLTATHIEIRNAGNEVIEENHFASLSPLKLHIEEGEIFLYSIIELTHKNMNVSLEENNGDVFINFEFIKPKSLIQILVYHTGTLTMLGELITGKFVNAEELFANNHKIRSCLISGFIGALTGFLGTFVGYFMWKWYVYILWVMSGLYY